MTLVPDSSAAASAYDSFAAAYSADSEAGLFNGYYTHPAIVNLPETWPGGASLTSAAAPARSP